MKYWNDRIKTLSPYTPGEQPKDPSIIKLNTNENPYPPSKKVFSVLKNLEASVLSRYPDHNFSILRKALSERYDLSEEKIFCGNGSDEILSLMFRAFLSSNDWILIPEPNYSLYRTLAQSYQVSYTNPNTENQIHYSLPKNLRKFSDHKAIFLSNPNAPTGYFYPLESIQELCKNHQGLVLIDEAYIDFAFLNAGIEGSALRLIREGYENLIVLRTFSKSFSLAGLRSGYAFGHESLIEALFRVKDSYNLGYLPQLLSYSALKDYAHMENNTQRIMQDRDFLAEELTKLHYKVLPSHSNFLFVNPIHSHNHPNRSVKEMFSKLREKGILLRYFSDPPLSDYLRITIGTKKEIDTLLVSLKEL